MKLSDSLIAASQSGSVDRIVAWAEKKGAKRIPDLREYLTWLQKYAVQTGLSFPILVAQSAHETGNWTSKYWVENLNPAGIGATGVLGGEVTYVGRTYKNGQEAALAHIIHMLAYTQKEKIKPGNWLYPYVYRDDELYLDPRYQAVFDAGWNGIIKTLDDFQVNGRWADVGKKPPWYGQRIVDKGNEMGSVLTAPLDNVGDGPIIDFPETPMPTDPDKDPRNLTTGRVPHPPVDIQDIHKPDVQSGYGYDLVSPRKIVGTCTHEWMGSMNRANVIEFFGPNGERYTNALVDYVNMKDGYLIRLNNPRGTRSPWASGGGVESGGLEGDGPFFYKKFGLGAINSKLVSTEIMKQDNEAYTAAQIETQAQLAAYWHDQDGQFWFEHPYTSKYGGVMSFLHFEFGTTSCGVGEVPQITKVQTRTREIMRQWQYSGSKPTDPVPPPNVPDLPTSELPAGIPLATAEEKFKRLRKINAKTGAVVAEGGFDPEGVISLGWAQKMAELFGQDYNKWKACGDWIFFQEPVDKTTFDIVSFDNWDGLMIRKNEKQGFIWA